MFDGAQVFRVEDVGAVFVFLDGQVVAGTLFHFQQIHVAIRRDSGGFGVVFPAAGIGAGALVGVAVVDVAGKQAAAGVGDAQCAMDEDFQFHVRAVCGKMLLTT